MFYVKEQLGDTVEVSIEINDENVFAAARPAGRRCRLTWRRYFLMVTVTCLAHLSFATAAAEK